MRLPGPWDKLFFADGIEAFAVGVFLFTCVAEAVRCFKKDSHRMADRKSPTEYTDSSNPAVSTNGQYDPTKRQKHGDIATSSRGNNSNLMKSYVYGNASCNSGVIQDTENVQGVVYNNFFTAVAPVSDPTWTNINTGVTSINNRNAPVTLTAGTQAAPANYKLSTSPSPILPIH